LGYGYITDRNFEKEVEQCFDPVMSLAVSSFFLERASGKLGDVFLAKLQYLAEKEFILTERAFAVCDRAVAMPWGPVLSKSYSSMKSPNMQHYWGDHIDFLAHEQIIDSEGTTATKQEANIVSLYSRFDYESELPTSFLNILDKTFEKHKPILARAEKRISRDWTPGQDYTDRGLAVAGYMLHDWCESECPEWKEEWDKRGESRGPSIRYRRIFELNSKGLSEDRIDDILASMLHQARFDKTYSVAYA
jgi:uncharacterized phage-associated protein